MAKSSGDVPRITSTDQLQSKLNLEDWRLQPLQTKGVCGAVGLLAAV